MKRKHFTKFNTLSKLGTEGNYHKWEKAETFPCKVLNKTKMPLPLLFNTVFKVLARAIKQQKDRKGMQIRDKKVNCVRHENPKDYTNTNC